MEISFRQACVEDAELLIRLYDASFYEDFVRYGECPGYGRPKEKLEDWKRFTVVTPADKTENVRFYTEKCGFKIVSAEKDGTVELTRFAL